MWVAVLVLGMVLTLWFALSPSQEREVKYLSSPEFKQRRGKGTADQHHQYRLQLELEVGKRFTIEQESVHRITTKQRGGDVVLAESQYRTRLQVEMLVSKVSSEGIEFKCTMLDFLGYDEGQNPKRKTMFEKIQQETQFAQFTVLLGLDGKVLEIDTSELRAKVIAGLHEAGQLPMNLEHALVIDNQVFSANGAAFGPLGRTQIRGPVFLLKGLGSGCPNQTDNRTDNLEAYYRNHIVVVDRGGCTFHEKALLANQLDAIALVVVDRTSQTEDMVATYMSGEGSPLPLVSVICNRDAGEAIEVAMRQDPSSVIVGGADADSFLVSLSGQGQSQVLEIVGGLEAVKALTPVGDDNRDNNEEELDDYVGLEYLLGELIRNRFSIFPSRQVGIGAAWTRSVVADQPSLRARVKEWYKLASITRADTDFSFGSKGDWIAEVHFAYTEEPVDDDGRPIKPQRQQQEDDQDGHGEQEEEGEFDRLGLLGVKQKTKGTYYVHLQSGLVYAGHGKSYSSTTNTKNSKVTMQADHIYSGGLQ
ncbi:hypothetical protein BASA81_003981 [Batrachochytrium salamandrivorans]|nr:hypothetical protein BASA81_003981 [Batrachochytrium salamandrivorans]